MKDINWNFELLKQIEAISKQGAIKEIDPLSSLWKGFGCIARVKFDRGPTRILKYIDPPLFEKKSNETSFNRKLQSFENENNWYQYQISCLQGMHFGPFCLGTLEKDNRRVFILEDLFFSGHQHMPIGERLSDTEINAILKWLVQLHIHFLTRSDHHFSKRGSYWHLETRKDEYNRLPNGKWRKAALKANDLLVNTRYSTVIHGDAKLSNFLYLKKENAVSGFDFQYTGTGSGVQDIVTFLVSSFTDEELLRLSDLMFDRYFDLLEKNLKQSNIDISFQSLKNEWESLIPYAWFDYFRFLKGWKPDSPRLGRFSDKIVLTIFKDAFESN
jgi:hypothetical protein